MNATAIKLFLMTATLAMLSSCGNIYPDDMGTADLKYDFQAAEQSEKYASVDYKIPEGSGIDVDEQSGAIAIVGDEGDFIFSEVGHREREISFPVFQKGEDIEDVCYITSTRLFALRSDGRLYDIRLLDSLNQGYTLKSKKAYDTPLGTENDAEGLCFDRQNQRLLIACKGAARIKGKNDPTAKAIYAFDLTSMSFVEEPVLVLRKEDLAKHLPGVENPLDYVEPAGIWVQPLSSYDTDWYILIGSTPAILKLRYNSIAENTSAEIKRYEPIDPGRYTQPEGIVILSNGVLLVVDEIEKEQGDSTVLATRLHIIAPEF